jgi:hypothetical protein
MFYNFFSKKPESEPVPVEENEDINTLASISYSIKRNETSPVIDIELNDYDDESATALCKLLDILSQDKCYIETINMLKLGLLQDAQEDFLVKVFIHLGSNSKDKIMQLHQHNSKDEPCVKPSDVLR